MHLTLRRSNMGLKNRNYGQRRHVSGKDRWNRGSQAKRVPINFSALAARVRSCACVYWCMKQPSPKALELERRQRHAVKLLHQGESPTVVARFLGLHRVTLYRWLRQEQEPGRHAAKPHFSPTPRLTDPQLAQLEQLLLHEAKAHGWPNELWTCRNIATLIQRHFGITYHPDHVSRFLHTPLLRLFPAGGGASHLETAGAYADLASLGPP